MPGIALRARWPLAPPLSLFSLDVAIGARFFFLLFLFFFSRVALRARWPFVPPS